VAFSYNVTVVDPNNLGGSADPLLVTDMQAALQNWAQYISGAGTLDVEIDFASTPTGLASSFTTGVPDGTLPNGATLIEPSSIYELTQGQHVPGSTSDITVDIDPSFLSQLWLNPSPGNGATVPPNLLDAVSAFTRELARGFGVNGYYQPNGTLSDNGQFETKFDSYISETPGGSAYFTGPTAEAVYGGPVPLTTDNSAQNYYALANAASDPLGQDLLNGITLSDGTTYSISTVDLAILKDIGVPVSSGLGNIAPGSGGTVFIPPSSTAVTAANQTVVLGPGDLNVSVSGPNALIFAGTGNDVISSTGDYAIVVGGMGPDTVFAAGQGAICYGGSGQMTFVNGSHASTFVAGQGTAIVYAGTGGGDFFDGKGQLIFVGQSSNSVVVATNGNDVLFGGAGGTITLFGAGNNNALVAGAGNETLNGGGATGNNVFFAGSGNAAMTGGSGTDLFGFAMGGAGGSDSIVNFTGQDRLLLVGYGAGEVQNAVNTQTHSGGSTMLTFSDHTTVTLVGVAAVNATSFLT
jgi:Ca2+-binding RTX toxin-like protein